MNTDKLLGMLLEAIDYSFLQIDGYDKTLTYPVIDKVQYIKEQVKKYGSKRDRQDTLKPEIKNDIKNALGKHGLMRGDKYAAEILQELATEFSKNIIVSSLYSPY